MAVMAYLVVRNDLPSLNPGKMAAQAFHAGNQIAKYASDLRAIAYVKEGIDAGADYFNKTVTLQANHEQMLAILGNKGDYCGDVVNDPTYPFWMDAEMIPFVTNAITVTDVYRDGKVLATRNELTCLWMIGDEDDNRFRTIFSGLGLAA